MEPQDGNAPSIPVYKTGVMLFNYCDVRQEPKSLAVFRR